MNKLGRFTTGSSILIGQHITVSFNSLSGFAQQPTSNTCGCELHLPSNYHDFAKEFDAVLADDDYTWDMDAC